MVKKINAMILQNRPMSDKHLRVRYRTIAFVKSASAREDYSIIDLQ